MHPARRPKDGNTPFPSTVLFFTSTNPYARSQAFRLPWHMPWPSAIKTLNHKKSCQLFPAPPSVAQPRNPFTDRKEPIHGRNRVTFLSVGTRPNRLSCQDYSLPGRHVQTQGQNLPSSLRQKQNLLCKNLRYPPAGIVACFLSGS